MEKILVTGAAGYVGHRVATELKKSGYPVRVFIKPNHRKMLENEGFEVYTGDVLDTKSISAACKGVDLIIHFIALVDKECNDNPTQAFEVTGIGTKNFLEAAVRNKIKHFIYASTYHVYDLIHSPIISESTPLGPTNLDRFEYGASHIIAELFCDSYKTFKDLKVTILRISNVYGGPIDRNVDRWSLVPLSFCKQAVENKKIVMTSDGSQKRDFVSIPDIVKAAKLVMNQETDYTVFNVGSGESISIFDLAKKVQAAYKRKFKSEIEIQKGNLKINDPEFTYDISRLKGLGYSPEDTMQEEFIKTFEALKP